MGQFPNTPAGDSWMLYVGYIPAGTITEEFIPITFLPTGDYKTLTPPQTLTQANTVLAQTIALIRSVTGDPNFDFWQLMNWAVISYYWIFLADFGQIQPIYYNYTSSGLPNLTSPVLYSSKNNIFVNNTLFTIYADYFANTIFPFLHQFDTSLVLPDFLALDENNSLKPLPMTFLRSYSCTERQLKGWLSATISVLTTDYAFIVGAYKLVVWIAGKWRKNRDKEGKSQS